MLDALERAGFVVKDGKPGSIEICCGCQIWTKTMDNSGSFNGDGHDILICKTQDLTSDAYVIRVKQDADTGNFVIAHFGTECTSFSKAAHPPYRSSEYPYGLPSVMQNTKRRALLSVPTQWLKTQQRRWNISTRDEFCAHWRTLLGRTCGGSSLYENCLVKAFDFTRHIIVCMEQIRRPHPFSPTST